MIRLLIPDFEYESLQAIPLKDLQENGIKGLLLDLDNTVTPWNDNTLTKDTIDWFSKIKAAGISACFISNNRRPERVAAVADALGIVYVYKANKPRKQAFLKGIANLGLKPEETAVVGDQIFTDVLGGNMLGLKTILVLPIHEREFAGTKVLRFMERIAGRKIRFTAKQENIRRITKEDQT